MRVLKVNSQPLVLGESGLFAIRTLPDGHQASLGLVILNSGMLPCMGPFRLNTQLVEELGDTRIATMRVDQSGKGESPTRGALTPSEAAIKDYDEAFSNLRRNGVRHTVLMGICSGAVDALRIAARRESVVGLILIDGYIERTTGWYLRWAATRLKNALAAGPRSAIAKIARKIGSPADPGVPTLKDELHFWRSLKLRDCYGEVLARGVQVLSIFSGNFWPYNHEGQMRRFLSSFDLSSFEEVCLAEADHTYTLSRHRQQLISAIRAWTECRFAAGPPFWETSP